VGLIIVSFCAKCGLSFAAAVLFGDNILNSKTLFYRGLYYHVAFKFLSFNTTFKLEISAATSRCSRSIYFTCLGHLLVNFN